MIVHLFINLNNENYEKERISDDNNFVSGFFMQR